MTDGCGLCWLIDLSIVAAALIVGIAVFLAVRWLVERITP